MADPFVYLLISGADFERASAKGTLEDESLRTEGFIHASPIDQLSRVANKFYARAVDLRVMVVAAADVASPVRWEPASGGLYPHVYGPLNMTAVKRVVAVTPDAKGVYSIQPRDLWPEAEALADDPSQR